MGGIFLGLNLKVTDAGYLFGLMRGEHRDRQGDNSGEDEQRSKYDQRIF